MKHKYTTYGVLIGLALGLVLYLLLAERSSAGALWMKIPPLLCFLVGAWLDSRNGEEEER